MRRSISGMAVAVYLCVSIGALAVLYELYDLKFPNHFVGDMYGLISMMRLAPLAIIGLVFALASVLCIRSVHRAKRPRVASVAVLAVTLFALVFIAVGTARSRHMWEIRAKFPEKSVEELVSIARHGDGQFAVYALGSKGEDAVPGLRDLLLDESAPVAVRHVAAHSLGGLGYAGVSAAVIALEEAHAVIGDADLRQTIDQALESSKKRNQP